jgi:hypothetical protein
MTTIERKLKRSTEAPSALKQHQNNIFKYLKKFVTKMNCFLGRGWGYLIRDCKYTYKSVTGADESSRMRAYEKHQSS